MKAQISSQFVAIIAILIAVIILLSWVTGFAGEGKRIEEIELCRLSVIAASKVKSISVKKHFIDFDCPRYDLVIKEKDVSKKGKVLDTLILKNLAEEAKTCYYQMDEGKSNPFKQYNLGDSRACLICSEVSFEEPLKNKALDVGSYMENTKMCSDCETYARYLTDSPDIPFEKKINTSLNYYLIYTHSAPGSLLDKNNILGKVGNFATSWMLDNGHQAGIHFLKQEDLHEIGCNFIAN